MAGNAGPADFKVVLDAESARLETAFKRVEERSTKLADNVQQKLDKVDGAIGGRVGATVGCGVSVAVGVGVLASVESGIPGSGWTLTW